MILDLELIIELAKQGIAVLALFMLYSINYNHLVNINNTLIEIRVLLDPDA